MTSTRSALFLTFFGLLAAGFFWLTDPTMGVSSPWLTNTTNQLDAANRAFPGTIVGLLGSAGVVVTGLWLLTRRSA